MTQVHLHHIEGEPPDEPAGHLCLYLFDIEEHIDFHFDTDAPLEVIAEGLAALLKQIILDAFTGDNDANSRQSSLQ